MKRPLRIDRIRPRRPTARAGHRPDTSRLGALGLGLALLLTGLALAPPAVAAPRHFPLPAELEPDVAFWRRVYAEVGTDAGLLHDNRDLSIVYEITKIPTGLSSRGRERHTEKRKKHYQRILERLASGKRTGLSREEQRVLALFPRDVSNKTLRAASRRVRFQLGQANKFRAGVIRSGAYKPFILENLREMNLPLEIANLPHVESSYTPHVYSRVGAAGLWQFTRSTGRRFMRVDHVVDERLDPFRASIAAARLLEQNHRVTGSWPLAITAYNHGAAGMRRAARRLGTRDIATIVRKYRSRTFGFASRNFYVEFLAANAVANDAETHFGPLVLDRPIVYETIELPWFARASHLAAAIGVDRQTLAEANPALRPSVWRDSKRVPKGFALKVPRASLPAPLARAIASMPPEHQYARQTRDTTYTVRRGDTLSTVARRHGVRISDLVALNGLASRHRIRIGQKLKLPNEGERPATRTAAYRRPKKTPEVTAPAAVPASGLYKVRRGDNLTRIAERFGLSVVELASLNDLRSRHRIAAGQWLRVSPQAPTASAAGPADGGAHPDGNPGLSPARTAAIDPDANDEGEAELVAELIDSDESPTEPSPGLLADPTDYTVASNGTIVVQTGETLGHYAEWLGLRASRLRRINGLRFGEPVGVQQRLRLDFSNVSPEVFERIRIEYHRALQESFFAEWEIEGTFEHRVGPGDSLWVLSNRRYDVPIWLLRQYNPDVDLDALSSGTTLTIPKLRQRDSESDRAVGNASAG